MRPVQWFSEWALRVHFQNCSDKDIPAWVRNGGELKNRADFKYLLVKYVKHQLFLASKRGEQYKDLCTILTFPNPATSGAPPTTGLHPIDYVLAGRKVNLLQAEGLLHRWGKTCLACPGCSKDMTPQGWSQYAREVEGMDDIHYLMQPFYKCTNSSCENKNSVLLHNDLSQCLPSEARLMDDLLPLWWTTKTVWLRSDLELISRLLRDSTSAANVASIIQELRAAKYQRKKLCYLSSAVGAAKRQRAGQLLPPQERTLEFPKLDSSLYGLTTLGASTILAYYLETAKPRNDLFTELMQRLPAEVISLDLQYQQAKKVRSADGSKLCEAIAIAANERQVPIGVWAIKAPASLASIKDELVALNSRMEHLHGKAVAHGSSVLPTPQRAAGSSAHGGAHGSGAQAAAGGIEAQGGSAELLPRMPTSNLHAAVMQPFQYSQYLFEGLPAATAAAHAGLAARPHATAAPAAPRSQLVELGSQLCQERYSVAGSGVGTARAPSGGSSMARAPSSSPTAPVKPSHRAPLRQSTINLPGAAPGQEAEERWRVWQHWWCEWQQRWACWAGQEALLPPLHAGI